MTIALISVVSADIEVKIQSDNNRVINFYKLDTYENISRVENNESTNITYDNYIVSISNSKGTYTKDNIVNNVSKITDNFSFILISIAILALCYILLIKR